MADLGGRYRLVRRLGAGGMGEVWLAADEALDDRPVAIKLMRSEMLADAQDVARFQREMRLASRMNHPNIMTVFTTGTDNGVPFMVMEYLEGSDLSRTPFSWRPDDVARIGRETCAALAYAHSLSPGVVHRDIKPANLFICTGSQVKVTDFGIAKAVSGTRLSATGSWIGTLPYMAPEQWLGEPAAFSNDIWAVGCVLYELLSGGLPRSYATPPEYLAAAMRGKPVPPLPAAADVPGWLSDTVMAMLQPAPGDRPAAAQCVQMLSSPPVYTDPDPVIPARPSADLGPQRASRSAASSARWSPRRRLLLSGALAVVTAAALVIGYVATHGGGGRNTLAGGAPDVSASALTTAHHMTSRHPVSDPASGHPVSDPASGHSASDPATGPSASGPSGSVHPTASHAPSRSSAPAQQAPPTAAAETWSQIGVRQGADLTSVSCAGQGLCAATASGGGIYVYQGLVVVRGVHGQRVRHRDVPVNVILRGGGLRQRGQHLHVRRQLVVRSGPDRPRLQAPLGRVRIGLVLRGRGVGEHVRRQRRLVVRPRCCGPKRRQRQRGRSRLLHLVVVLRGRRRDRQCPHLCERFLVITARHRQRRAAQIRVVYLVVVLRGRRRRWERAGLLWRLMVILA